MTNDLEIHIDQNSKFVLLTNNIKIVLLKNDSEIHIDQNSKFILLTNDMEIDIFQNRKFVLLKNDLEIHIDENSKFVLLTNDVEIHIDQTSNVASLHPIPPDTSSRTAAAQGQTTLTSGVAKRMMGEEICILW